MKNIIVAILITQYFNLYSQQKYVCLTVDDLPVVSYGINDIDFHQRITQNLTNIFDKYNVPAIGYVNEKKLYVDGKLDSNKVKVLELWLKSGYELGNHTYSHLDYHNSTFENYTKEIVKGALVSSKLSKKYGINYQYFRHPYLNIGLRKPHADSLSEFLADNGYIEAPVTIDNEDYLFAHAYHRAYISEDNILMKKIGDSYVKYMTDKLFYFEQMSDSLFDRQIKQTLLIHASLLNSEYLDELLDVYVSNGYLFISQTEVLKDQAYQSEITKYGSWGISWMERWALSQGKRGAFFKGDPITPTFIKDIIK